MTFIKSTTDEDIVLDLKKILFEQYLNLQNQTFYNLSMLSSGSKRSVALPLPLCKPYVGDGAVLGGCLMRNISHFFTLKLSTKYGFSKRLLSLGRWLGYF